MADLIESLIYVWKELYINFLNKILLKIYSFIYFTTYANS